MPRFFIWSISFSGYSFACSRSRTPGLTSRSTKFRTTSTTACSSVLNSMPRYYNGHYKPVVVTFAATRTPRLRSAFRRRGPDQDVRLAAQACTPGVRDKPLLEMRIDANADLVVVVVVARTSPATETDRRDGLTLMVVESGSTDMPSGARSRSW